MVMVHGPNPGGGLAEEKILNLKRPVKAMDITAGIVAHKKNLAVQCQWHHQEKVNHTPDTHIPSPSLLSPSCHCCCNQFPFGGPCRGHNILSAMATTIVQNSVSPKVNPKLPATHTTAMATTIMRNFHDGPKVVQVSCNTHYGNGRNNYAEFSHKGHQTRTTHYQGGGGIAKKEQGSIFFELPSELGLPNYVSGRLPIYGNGVSIYV